ncbi:MAG: class III cytochrome C family protein [SAR324 cluster bacterium]|nr:class III cytochrome C family protein [SAR324 cluster bacterium]
MIRITSTILILTVLSTWLISSFPKAAIGPGDLLEGHRQSENSCLSCHALFQGVPGKKCQSCHISEKIGLFTVDGRQIDRNKTRVQFHSQLAPETCLSCHHEHQGRSGSKVVSHFSHQLVKPKDLKNCVACHQKPSSPIHQRPDQDCTQCHTTANWVPSDFDHRQYFRFDKKHNADCKSCHPGSDYREYTCYNCHEHSPQKIEHEHVKEGIQQYSDCVKCHRSGDEHEAKRIWKSNRSGQSEGIYKDRHDKRSKKDRKHSKDDDHHEKKHDDDDY